MATIFAGWGGAGVLWHGVEAQGAVLQASYADLDRQATSNIRRPCNDGAERRDSLGSSTPSAMYTGRDISSML